MTMLLQRASAGSGKTYKLAKTYIRLFISHRHPGERRYTLLKPAQLRDAHSHILGVTFTNKATNEMKQRIVEKLAQLAMAVPEPGMEPQGYKFPDYLLDFTGEADGADPYDDVIYQEDGTPVTRRQVTRTAKGALAVLLNDYGNFNISTIDSFFQGILRTMAYELRLNDNYHVELNDDFLAQVGVDMSLSAVRHRGIKGHAHRQMADFMWEWLQQMITERLGAGERWDPFAKGSAAGTYAALLAMTKKMSHETHKKARRELGDFLEHPDRFGRFHRALLRASARQDECHNTLLQTVVEFEHACPDTSQWAAGIGTAFTAIKEAAPRKVIRLSSNKFERNASAYTGELKASDLPFKAKTAYASDHTALELFTRLCDELATWRDCVRYWQDILSRVHYIGAQYFVEKNIRDFQVENNIIPLSATNDLLHDIIDKDSAPFIYERTGVYLHHYLLDEFQDTSELQWNNIRPLLEESMSNGYDNLIIGDAKQSIYRFRNAEPDIIAHRVEQELPDTVSVPAPGTENTPAYDRVNTNHRSSRHVVTFNNTVFKTLPTRVDMPGDNKLAHLYESSTQNVRKKGMTGYVRIDFSATEQESYASLGPRIDSLRERGCPLSRIAILVSRNEDGQHAIRELMHHNDRMKLLDPQYAPIEIISDESLKLADSMAVKVVLAILSRIARGHAPGEDDENAKSIADYELQRLVANYHIALGRGAACGMADLPDLEQCGSVSDDSITEMLRDMAAVTLPSLVECIAARFLGNLGATHTAYLSAFQDVVLQYSDTYPADVASFLSWWDEHGSNFSISAPDGQQAVKVMTVHKSKGLEFEVVIIPFAKWGFDPSRTSNQKEILWVRHTPEGLEGLGTDDIPKLLPVTPGEHMADPANPFHKEYADYALKCRADQLNKVYVAFTRAVRELYVDAPASAKPSLTLGSLLRTALHDWLSTGGSGEANLMNPAEATLTDDLFEYGTPVTDLSPAGHEVADVPVAGKQIHSREIVLDRYCTGQPLPSAFVELDLES